MRAKIHTHHTPTSMFENKFCPFCFIMHLVPWWEANSSNTMHGLIYCYISRWVSVGKKSAPRIGTIGK